MTIKHDLAFVIEADAHLACDCENVLRSVGFDVETFLDGGPAYERLSIEPAPWLVLVDLDLPNISGHEIAWEMWFNLENSHIVIIAPDNETADIYRDKGGVDHVLVKPVSQEEIKKIARPYLYSGHHI